jgi:mutator protein MutT
MAEADVVLIAVAVVEHGGRVLIGRRPPGVPLAGFWEFPGGKIGAGETAADAARRECREETGLAVDIQGTYCEVEEAYGHGRVRIRFLAASPIDPGQDVAEPFRWVAISQLADYQFPRANRAVIRELTQRSRTGL